MRCRLEAVMQSLNACRAWKSRDGEFLGVLPWCSMLEIKNDGAGAKSHGMELRKGPERLVPRTLNTTPRKLSEEI
jgi:hypothetical protein